MQEPVITDAKSSGIDLDRRALKRLMRRMATPGEIAASILYFASDAAGFVTGAALAIDGGSSASC